MDHLTPNEFLRLSAVLNYQLSARRLRWDHIARIILDKKVISPQDSVVFQKVYNYLLRGYGSKKRRLGPLSILHPLRVTAILSRAQGRFSLLNNLTCLLHDAFEDIHPEDFLPSNWNKLDEDFQLFLTSLPDTDRWYLMERLDWLTKRSGETYYHYVGRLLQSSANTPEAVRVKLADRLDNTLDMRIEIEDPLQDVDFFQTIFQMMFITNFCDYAPQTSQASPGFLDSSQRLYQLFKNIVLMSLVRHNKIVAHDEPSQVLLANLADASMKEAQRILLHIFSFYEQATPVLRGLILETMDYVQKGGIDNVTLPASGQRLDGLILSTFDVLSQAERKTKLQLLQRNKPLMIEASLAFIVIFLRFAKDPSYYIRGITSNGISPHE